MPESLFNSRRNPAGDGGTDVVPGFKLATQAIRALQRLKAAGFMIIGLGREELFHGFATPGSCREFLKASELDDLIIPQRPGDSDGCSPALIQAAAKWLLDLDRSFIIGKDETISSADLTGCTPLKIDQRASTQSRQPHCVRSLSAAVERILQLATGDTATSRAR